MTSYKHNMHSMMTHIYTHTYISHTHTCCTKMTLIHTMMRHTHTYIHTYIHGMTHACTYPYLQAHIRPNSAAQFSFGSLCSFTASAFGSSALSFCLSAPAFGSSALSPELSNFSLKPSASFQRKKGIWGCVVSTFIVINLHGWLSWQILPFS
jgi:hypothetical protein